MASVRTVADVRAALHRKEAQIVSLQQRIVDEMREDLKRAKSDEERMQIRRIVEKCEDRLLLLQKQETALLDDLRQRTCSAWFTRLVSLIARFCCLPASFSRLVSVLSQLASSGACAKEPKKRWRQFGRR